MYVPRAQEPHIISGESLARGLEKFGTLIILLELILDKTMAKGTFDMLLNLDTYRAIDSNVHCKKNPHQG